MHIGNKSAYQLIKPRDCGQLVQNSLIEGGTVPRESLVLHVTFQKNADLCQKCSPRLSKVAEMSHVSFSQVLSLCIGSSSLQSCSPCLLLGCEWWQSLHQLLPFSRSADRQILFLTPVSIADISLSLVLPLAFSLLNPNFEKDKHCWGGLWGQRWDIDSILQKSCCTTCPTLLLFLHSGCALQDVRSRIASTSSCTYCGISWTLGHSACLERWLQCCGVTALAADVSWQLWQGFTPF